MKTRWLSSIVFLFLLGALLLTTSGAQAQDPQPYTIEGGGGPGPVSSAFTYQGMLKLGGMPVNGTCDFVFTLWDQSGSGSPPSGGNQIGVADVQLGVSVSRGLFTVVLNASRKFEPELNNNYAFKGQGRWLQIGVACPASTSITTLSPRQPLWAVPFAISLMPGARIEGSAYQNLKVVSTAPSGSIPAGVTGEITVATDGVGVYGSNEVATTGATGTGVWGRTWSPNGSGVLGTGMNGAVGVKAESSGSGRDNPAMLANNTNSNGNAIVAINNTSNSVTSAWASIVAWNKNSSGGNAFLALNSSGFSSFIVSNDGEVTARSYSTIIPDTTAVTAKNWGVGTGAPAIYAEALNTTSPEPGGIAIFGKNHSADTAILAQNVSTGDNYRALSAAGVIVFRVQNNGQVIAPATTLTGGSDLAEQFEVSDAAAPEPGTLMVIDAQHPGQLKPSSSAYDSKVAGVVSGAGGLQPGVTLSEQDGVAIALAGRVYVNAEAQSGAIAPGDLLTSSDVPGYAMKASDRSRAPGAVIGKAMTGLSTGTGLVLVLVSLQ